TRKMNQVKLLIQDQAIEITDRIGAADCDAVDLTSLILNEQFDLIHFAGHGFFDDKHPDEGGWVLSKDVRLSAREIFKTRRVPRLVVANACFSAVVNARIAPADEMN